MKNLIKRCFIKLKIIKANDKFSQLVDDGNLIIGKNTNLNNLSITVINPKKGFPNIIIGDNCMISGSFAIYSSDSQIIIGDRVFIGPSTELFCHKGITIESDVMLSWGITVIDTNAHSLIWEERQNDVTDWIKGAHFKNWDVVETKAVNIKSKSWIGFKSIILKGVVIAEGTIIAAGSVITKSTEDYSVYAGNPAKFIKKTD